MASQRRAALGVATVLIGLAAAGCGPGGPVVEREDARLTVTALGTSAEVDAALGKGNATDPAAGFAGECRRKGVSASDVDALEPSVKLRRVDLGKQGVCLVLEATCMLPDRKAGLRFACPDQRVAGLAYDACRAMLDDLFGRPTRAATARPKRLFVYFEPGGTRMNEDAFFAELRPKVDALCRKGGWKGGDADEPPVKAARIQHDEAVAVEFDEGWEDAAAETAGLAREALRMLGWRVEK